jgi:predicted RNA binding protein YcfA (HicA-like mRNA interferase family)
LPEQSALPAVSGTRLVKALQAAGFELTRVSGSHHRLKHKDGRATTVPVHANRDVPKGTLRSILRDCELTVTDLRDLL